jgi:hypothetical protein
MIRFKISAGEKFEYEYCDHKIVVTAHPTKRELIVDDKVQDAHNGLAASSNLTGEINVDGVDKKIKVSIGRFFLNTECSVFVDHEQIELKNRSEF